LSDCLGTGNCDKTEDHTYSNTPSREERPPADTDQSRPHLKTVGNCQTAEKHKGVFGGCCNDKRRENITTKPELGRAKKANTSPRRFVREIRVADKTGYEIGKEICVDIFNEGEYVDISGVTIGKGFQGGMKRWNWKAGEGGHGSMHHRRVGSIGASSYPSRVFRGQHMPGQMGNEKSTVQNLEIVKIDKENNLIAVKGAVPGHKEGYLVIRNATKKPAPPATEQAAPAEAAADNKTGKK